MTADSDSVVIPEASPVDVPVSAIAEAEWTTTTIMDKTKSINVSVSTVKRYNLMVAGPSGSGKSTFCKRLLRRYFSDFKLETSDGPTRHIGEKGRGEKVQGDTRIIVTVIDTPGFGDSIDNNDRFDPVENYIVEQNKKYEKQELYRRSNRQEDDTRIHCCFYFLAPHRVTLLDCEFMRRLQSKVAIVPIVAKADTMTISELGTHLQQIYSFMQENSIRVFDFNEADIDTSWLNQNEVDSNTFARIGMTMAKNNAKKGCLNTSSLLPQINNVFAVISGEREYMWGIASEEDPNHSDTQRLHKILFQDGSLGNLQEHADEIHDQWRKKHQANKFSQETLFIICLAFIIGIFLVVYGPSMKEYWQCFVQKIMGNYFFGL